MDASAPPTADPASLRAALIATLEARGYQPVVAANGEVRLRNCPFHALVDDHRNLICGTNLAICEGLLAGFGPLGEPGFRARLDPQPDACCVLLTPVNNAGESPV